MALPDGTALGERLRARDLSAAPEVLNLVENRTPRRASRSPRCCARSPPPRSAARRAGHVVGVTGPPGAGKSTLLSELVRAWRAAGRTVAVLAVDPSSKRCGGALLGDRARIAFDPADTRVFIRSTAAGGPARRPGRRDARRRPGARGGVRRRRRRDGRRRAERDRGRRGRRHRRRRRAAGVRRRAAVPEVGDHGDPRRARRHEGRPRRGRPARAPRPARRAALARRARDAGRRGLLAATGGGIDELVEALDAHRAAIDLPARRAAARRASALADFVAEHGERGLRALGGRRAARAGSHSRRVKPTSRRSCRASRRRGRAVVGDWR